MDPEDFTLQRVDIRYTYPESPIFLEKAALVVNRHLKEYTEFTRAIMLFYLSGEEPITTVRLLSDRAALHAESLSPGELASLVNQFRGLMGDLFRELGFANVSNAYVTCRYFRSMDSTQEVIRALIRDFMKVPTEYRNRFGGNPVDLTWRVSFSYRTDFECNIRLYVLRNEEEVRAAFPKSADECGAGGVMVRLKFAFPSERTTVSLEEVNALFALVQEEGAGIASMAMQSIRE